MPKKDSTYDRIERALFKDREEASSILSQREMEIKKRMMLCVSKKMEDPLIQDTELVNFLMNGCGGNTDAVSQSQAYRDIGMINRLVGNIQLAAKAWYRYMIVEGGKKAFNMAIDKEDEKFDYSQLIPPSFEPSDDVTLLEGLEPIEDLEGTRSEMRSRFKGMLSKKAVDIRPIEEEEEE